MDNMIEPEHSPRARLIIWGLRAVAILAAVAVVLSVPFLLYCGRMVGVVD